MTWGSDCHQCGRLSCSWVYGDECEGRANPSLVDARDEFDRLPLYQRIIRRRPSIAVRASRGGNGNP